MITTQRTQFQTRLKPVLFIIILCTLLWMGLILFQYFVLKKSHISPPFEKESFVRFLIGRLPHLLVILTGGCALSLSGCIMQGVFRAPLAEPYLLGVANGGALGAILTGKILSQHTDTFYFAGILMGGMLTTLILYTYAKLFSKNKNENAQLLLVGATLSLFFLSLIQTISHHSKPSVNFTPSVLVNHPFWLPKIFFFAIFSVIIIGTMTVLYARELNAISIGDTFAKRLGFPPQKTKFILLFFSTILTTAAVFLLGPIGFIGLILPHGVRFFVGSDHRKLLPFTGVLGATFLLPCDITAELLGLPLGAVTVIIGAPVFLLLLAKK